MAELVTLMMNNILLNTAPFTRKVKYDEIPKEMTLIAAKSFVYEPSVRIKLEELNPKTEKINGSMQHGRERKPKINPEIFETLSITISSHLINRETPDTVSPYEECLLYTATRRGWVALGGSVMWAATLGVILSIY